MTSGHNWRDDAACLAHDPETFFRPDPSRGWATPKAICRGCAVRDDCREWALDTERPPHRDGIYGGLDPVERQALWRKRRRVS